MTIKSRAFDILLDKCFVGDDEDQREARTKLVAYIDVHTNIQVLESRKVALEEQLISMNGFIHITDSAAEEAAWAAGEDADDEDSEHDEYVTRSFEKWILHCLGANEANRFFDGSITWGSIRSKKLKLVDFENLIDTVIDSRRQFRDMTYKEMVQRLCEIYKDDV